MATRTTSHK